jgi:hypothetical protein
MDSLFVAYFYSPWNFPAAMVRFHTMDAGTMILHTVVYIFMLRYASHGLSLAFIDLDYAQSWSSLCRWVYRCRQTK